MKNFNFKQFVKSWVIPMMLEIGALLLIFNYLLIPTWVPSGSMIPTIAERTLLFTTKIYNKSSLNRGDIISFQSDELGKTLIKRLVGLPGETVDVAEDGSVSIDGVKLDEWYVVNHMEGAPQHFEVPADCYLFFGDNRSGSFDARMWEQPYIPTEAVIGRGVFTLWPLTNLGVLK